MIGVRISWPAPVSVLTRTSAPLVQWQNFGFVTRRREFDSPGERDSETVARVLALASNALGFAQCGVSRAFGTLVWCATPDSQSGVVQWQDDGI